MAWTLRFLFVLTALAAAQLLAAAEPFPPNESVTASTSQIEELQEVSVTAKHLQLDWAQRNELIQKAATFVFGIADVPDYGDWPPIWFAPVCPLVTGLRREQDQFILRRISEIARTAGARLGGEKCHPNLYIFITAQPQDLLRLIESRRYLVFFGHAAPSQVDQFINAPGAVKVWHNTFQGTFGMVAPVSVVVDGTRLEGVSERQFADYLGMVSLAEIKSPAHLGEANTILRLFDSAPEAAPAGLSDWDQAFLKIVYHRDRTLANKRAWTARRMVRELAP